MRIEMDLRPDAPTMNKRPFRRLAKELLDSVGGGKWNWQAYHDAESRLESAFAATPSLIFHPDKLTGLPDQPPPPTVTLAAVRAALMTVIDDGFQCSKGCDLRHPWSFNSADDDLSRADEDDDNKQRLRFADAICAYLTARVKGGE